MGKAAKNTTTNGKTTMKRDGIDKGKQRQGKIRESKQRDRNDVEDREKAENLRKAREEEEKAENLRKAREEEAARLKELKEKEEAARLKELKEKEEAARLKELQERNSKFGNLMFLVIEFPKGGNSWFHKYKKFMRSNGVDDEDLRDFLEFFMPNMGEPANYVKGDTQRDIDWFIAFYWRMQWVKHGLYHGIAEMDFYRKIYHLYLKASIDNFLYDWWSFAAGYYPTTSTTTPPCTAEVTVMAWE